jgi:hypothetical protein
VHYSRHNFRGLAPIRETHFTSSAPITSGAELLLFLLPTNPLSHQWVFSYHLMLMGVSPTSVVITLIPNGCLLPYRITSSRLRIAALPQVLRPPDLQLFLPTNLVDQWAFRSQSLLQSLMPNGLLLPSALLLRTSKSARKSYFLLSFNPRSNSSRTSGAYTDNRIFL